MNDRAAAILELVRSSEDKALSAFLIAVKVGLPSSTVRRLVREDLKAHLRLQEDGLVLLNSRRKTVDSGSPAPARPLSVPKPQMPKPKPKPKQPPPQQQPKPKPSQSPSPSSSRPVTRSYLRSYLEQRKRKAEARELVPVADKSFADCLPPELRQKLGW